MVQYEGFRNRQEAYLWSSLSRKIFKSSDVDIARIIGHLHPASLKDDWDEKRKGLDRLAERVFDHLRDQMPKNTTEALQDKVEQLIKENEKLKGHRPSLHLLSVPPNLKPLLIVNAYVWTNPNHSSPLQLLLARDALWTVTSNPLHPNWRRLLHLLLSLLIHFMTI